MGPCSISKNIFVNISVWFVCVVCLLPACQYQRRALDSVELELETENSHRVARNQQRSNTRTLGAS